MNRQRVLSILSGLIAVLALIAAGTGALWLIPGLPAPPHYDFTTLRGQTVEVWGGGGLYRLDSVSGASQEIAQDFVTLFAGIPLLIVASLLAARGLLRGKVLLAGMFGYFLYTYTSMCMLTTYNEFFLIYVALMSLSLFGFVLSLLAIDANMLPDHFSDRLPRKSIGSFLILVGAMLALMWIGRIVPPLLDATPPAGIDNYTTLVIQALDLGIIAPTSIVTGVLLLRRALFGYLFSPVMLMNGVAMGLATSAMAVGQMLAGVEVSPIEAGLFFGFAIVNMVLAGLLLWSIREDRVAERTVNQVTPTRTPGDYLASPHEG